MGRNAELVTAVRFKRGKMLWARQYCISSTYLCIHLVVKPVSS